MLNYLTLIFCCQLAGETLARSLGLPVPGPVVGMVFLFIYLAIRGQVPGDLSRVGDGLLKHLSLLFVPAGVGVMLHFRLLGDDWLPIALALVVSTVVTIIITAWLMARLNKADRHG
ncbi:MAG: CidA/LrgA family protein [Pseudomonadota bacterium]